MHTKNFFKPTIIYKEYMILNLIEKDPNITQREISTAINIAVSMVNTYIDMYEKKGLLTKEHISTKTVRYHITKKGIERRKLLNIWYLEASNKLYNEAKDNISVFLNKIIEKKCSRLLLYGAGEVAEIILKSMNDDNKIPLKVLAVVDDNKNKRNQLIINTPIIDIEDIVRYDHDGILISSYTHNDAIYHKLIQSGYPEHKIFHFFDNN
ncbi:winged helix-turn-helix transcriptional regulator [Acholeplasma laidlawii]|uniref:winged helix-turn-helix transcriptional regulator n=1 Tax=Acholeplasma laidlawii TaxID=2148 RepID=UPI003F918BDC